MSEPKLTTSLEQRQTTQQRLTKQQLIMFELLACTDMSLEQRVTQEVQDNPAFDAEAYTAGESDEEQPQQEQPLDNEPIDNVQEMLQDDDGYYGDNDKIRVVNHDPADFTPQYQTVETPSDILKEQLSFRNLTAQQKALCDYLVDSLDSNGFLTRMPDEIMDDYFNASAIDVSPSDVRTAISVIRTLEPVGIGAVGTQDCLLMQLAALDSNPQVQLAITIIRDCYRYLTSQNFDYIKSSLHIDNEQLRQALAVVNNLNPKPLQTLQPSSPDPLDVVTPEFVVTLFDGKLSVTLTGAKLPPLHISDQFLQMADDKEAQVRDFARSYVERANDFIAALQMRQQTMMKIMCAILVRQHDYFLTGDRTLLRPMMLQDIADDTHLNPTTISRVTSNKYAQTPYGIVSLKSLFTMAVKSVSAAGDISRNMLLSLLQEIIDGEEKSNPLTDDQIAAILATKGYPLKRRTISKYRATLNIPSAQTRKVLVK